MVYIHLQKIIENQWKIIENQWTSTKNVDECKHIWTRTSKIFLMNNLQMMNQAHWGVSSCLGPDVFEMTLLWNWSSLQLPGVPAAMRTSRRLTPVTIWSYGAPIRLGEGALVIYPLRNVRDPHIYGGYGTPHVFLVESGRSVYYMYCRIFLPKMKAKDVPTVDGRNPAPPQMCKPCK